MTKRFWPHFSTIFGIHALLLLGSFQLIQNELVKGQTTSASIMKIQVASQVLIPKPKLEKIIPKKDIVEKKEVAKVPEVKPQAQPEATPTTSELSSMARADLKSIYYAELRAKIEENKSYPLMSKRLGQTGLVVVAFTLLKDGSIINARIETPSNFEKLNASALEAVTKVQRFKPIPSDLGETQMDIKVPVKFFEI